jgi:hypothetical protein
VSVFPVPFGVPALACYVIPSPLRTSALLTVGLPEHTRLDLNGITAFRRYETRSGWASPISRGRRCPPDQPGHHRSAPAASQRPALHPRCHNPSAREVLTRHQRRFTRLTRPIFPLPVAPGRNGNPSAFPSGFAPRRYQRRTPRWEQVSRTLTQSYTFDISRTSQRQAHSPPATSRRTPR